MLVRQTIDDVEDDGSGGWKTKKKKIKNSISEKVEVREVFTVNLSKGGLFSILCGIYTTQPNRTHAQHTNANRKKVKSTS